MGRKSALTPEQWIEVERRHVVGGESINSLAKEFKVDESALRRKINPNKSESKRPSNPLRSLAEEKVRADSVSRDISERISELPYAKQQIVSDLARKLTNVSGHLASAAEFSAATAHRLSGIAHGKVQEIDDSAPVSDDSLMTLKGIAVLTRMANEASEIPLGLLKANKDMVDSMNREPDTEVISGLEHFYGGR